MNGPNPKQNTIFRGGLTPEHLEIVPKNLYKMTGSLSKWSRRASTDSSTSIRFTSFSHFVILFPMPPSANPDLSMGHFGIAWATCMISKCCHQKRLASTFQPTMKLALSVAFLDFASNASKWQPWPLNGPFWNNVGYLHGFQGQPL